MFNVAAHQPRVVFSEEILIEEPEISKAYYGELEGKEHYYKINSDREFDIYINLLTPGYEFTHSVSAELIKDGEILYSLDGENYEWTVFYEEYAKDYYLKGPELGKDFKSNQKLPAGEYIIKVFNDNNEGKYVLAVGDEESFPFNEIVKSIIVIPYLKISFFGKYYLLLIPLFLLLVIYLLIKKIKNGKNKSN